MAATKLEPAADRQRGGPDLFRVCQDLFFLLVMAGLSLPLAASAAAANDNFTNRTSLAGTIVVTASNVGATLEANEPMHAGDPGGRSLWWSWTAAHTGKVTMGTSGSEVDTLLAIYTGTTLATLVEVASNDDASFGVTTSRVTFNTVAGTTYQIAVDAYEAEEGEVRLTILENDAFADRLALVGTNLLVSGHNFDATAEPKEPAHAGRSATRSVWWTWTAPTNGLVGLVLSGANTNAAGGSFYKTLAVYTGGVLSNLTARASNGSVLSLTNRLAFNAMANTVYQIAADGVSGSAGQLQLALAFTAAPTNDFFAGQAVLAGGSVTVSGSNVGATSEPGEPNHGGYPATRSIWWAWTAPTNGLVRLTASGDNLSVVGGGPFYKLLGVYTGATVSELVTNKLSSGLVLTNHVIFDAVAGVAYRIALDGYNGAQGAVSLELAFTVAPANDNFEDAIPLAGTEPSVNGSNVAASRQSGEPSHAAPGGRSVWWRWTAPFTGPVVISTAGSSFNTLLAVYTGAAVDALDSVASNNDFDGGPASQVSFNAVAGTNYGIAVDGFLGDSGDIRLTLAQQAEWRLEMPGFAGDGAFEFSFVGQLGTSYVIEVSTNLTQWDMLETLTNSTDRVTFRDGSTTNFPHRFYRARLP